MVPLLYHAQDVIQRKVRNFLALFQQLIGIETLQPKVGRPSALSPSEAVTCAVLKQKRTIKTKIAAWETFGLPTRCSYKTFVVALNRWAWLAALGIALILQANRQRQHWVKHIDATVIRVGKLKNARQHRTLHGIADYGKTGEGWFFGLKLHLIADLLGNFLSVIITPGNVSDKDVPLVLRLAHDIWGLLIGDAGYVSQRLAQAFNIERVRLLLVKPYKNMKKIATKLQGLLCGTRMLIERHFRNLKEFYGLETNLPRSVRGYFAHYCSAILAYLIV